MLKLLLHIVFLLLIFPLESHAQEPYTWRLTDENGLPSMEIYGLMQDSRGYMWIATDGGTCRYNGKDLKVYQHSDRKGNATARIREDHEGNIWFKNFNSQLFYIDQQTDSFHLFNFPEELKVGTYFDYGFWDSSLMINTGMLYFLNPKTLDYQTDTLPDSYRFKSRNRADNRFNLIYPNEAWIIGDNGKFATYKKQNKQYNFPCKLPIFGLRNTIFNYGQDSILVFCENGQNIFLAAKQNLCDAAIINLVKQENFTIYKACVDKNLNIWLATNQGLCFIERQGQQLLAPKLFFPQFKVSSVTQDREGNIWFGTLGNGVFIMPSYQMFHYSKTSNSLLSSPINKLIATDAKHIALAQTKGNLAYLNTETLEALNIQGDNENNVTALHLDQANKRLYFCAKLLSYLELDKDVSKVHSPNTTMAFAGHSMTIYKKNQLLVGTNGRAFSIALSPNPGKSLPPPDTYHPSILAKGEYVPHRLFKDSIYRIDFREVRTNAILINEYIDDEFWIAYNDSLFHYKNGIGSSIVDQNQQTIIGVEILQVDASTIWVGTVGHGLLKIVDGKVVQNISTTNGIPDNYCRALSLDGDWLWCATNKGVFGLDTKMQKIHVFNKLDGLVTEEIRDIEVLDGRVWLATPKGLIFFDKNLSSQNQIPPLIQIIKLTINKEDQDLHRSRPTLSVDYDQSNFRFTFQSTTLKSRGNFTYEYKLQAQHQAPKEWIKQASEVNFVRFQDLQPGKYRFEVRARNEDGLASIIPASIEFEIHPPYWQTWWFHLLIYSLIASFLVLIVVLRYRTIRQRENIRHTINQLRTQALQSQMNPHFVFNAMSTIQSFWLHKQPKVALSYHSKFARLMRLIFEYSQEISIPLAEEIKFLKLYIQLEQVRIDQEVELEFDVEEILLEDEIHIPPLLLQPIVENAFKHGLLHKEGRKKLKIQIQQQDKFLYCSVNDNGIGREAASEINQWKEHDKRKNSTSIIQERLKILHQNVSKKTPKQIFTITDLQSDQNKAIGTRIELLIPIM